MPFPQDKPWFGIFADRRTILVHTSTLRGEIAKVAQIKFVKENLKLKKHRSEGEMQEASFHLNRNYISSWGGCKRVFANMT